MAITIDNAEVQGWPKELYSYKGSAFERKVRCAWSVRKALAIELSTYPDSLYPYDTSSGAILYSVKPEPEKNSKSSGNGTGIISYENAILTCQYSTWQGPQYDLTKGLLTEYLTPGRGGRKFTEDKLYWSDGTALDRGEAPQQIACGLTYTLQIYELAVVPDAVRILPGYINNNSWATIILGVTFTPYTLLYLGAKVTRTLKTDSVTKFNVAHKFSHRYNGSYGWNYAWRKSANAYQPIYRDAGGANQLWYYPDASFIW